MAQHPPSSPLPSAQDLVPSLAGRATQPDHLAPVQQTNTTTDTAGQSVQTHSLSMDATMFIPACHEHILRETHSNFNPEAPEFIPEGHWREASPHRQSSVNIYATEFMPGMQSHHCMTRSSNMNALAPVFVPRVHMAGHLHLQRMQLTTILSVNQAKRLVRFMPGAAVQTPNPLAAEGVPRAQQWGTYTCPAPTPELTPEGQYQSRLYRVQEVNDRDTIPDYEPAARVVSTKHWNNKTKQYEGRYEEERELVQCWLHHVDFFGRVVYTKSATKPATTIAILKASGKWLSMGTEYKSRNHFLVTSASRYLDPVVYYGKPEVLDELHGTALENACVGQCDKFYSRYGFWQEDYYDPDEDEPYLDTLYPEDYEKGQLIINGCTAGFRTREQVLTAGTEEKVAIDSTRRAALQSRKARGLVKSRLAYCSTSEESAVVRVGSYSTGKTPNAVQSNPPMQSSSERHSALDTTSTQSHTLRPMPSTSTSVSSEDLDRRLNEIGPLSTNASWADDIDVEDEVQAVIGPQASFEPSAPLETILEETLEEPDSLHSEEDIVAGDEVPMSTEPSSSDESGHSHRSSISSSDDTPPTSIDEANGDQVDDSGHQDDDNDSVYDVNDQAYGQEDIAPVEVAERTDDEIFGMTLEQEYENVHGVPMPVETSVQSNDIALVSTQRVSTVVTAQQPALHRYRRRALPWEASSGRAVRLLVGAFSNGRVVPFLTTMQFGTVHNSLLYVVGTASRVDSPYMSFAPKVAFNEVVRYQPSLPQQRVVEFSDDEEEINGTVIHPNVTIRGSNDDNITPAVIVNDITPEGNVEESTPVASPATNSESSPAAATGGSHPQTPQQQPPRRRVRFVEPPQVHSPASTASRYSSLAELVSGYDQWPDFSAIHCDSPSSSASSGTVNHDDETLAPIPTLPKFGSVRRRRRAGFSFARVFSSRSNTVHLTVVGEGPSQTTVVEKKSWIKKGLGKVKGLFSKKRN
ncbi:hypothetical protein EDD37DRAFT_411892 [Exophiala viscosa]|uniref:uncharacterized protein n=1 Tax=Exophiala viscosa TaxID=2486360 RepID=UPI0021947A0F|nr:hypothetical protein EDD37DRAFT_411892 [Exophiala viscosa]